MKTLNRITVTFIVLLTAGCFIHKETDCRMVFNLCVVNESEDTVQVEPKKYVEDGIEYSSAIKSISTERFVLLPFGTNTVKVRYEWVGTDGCSIFCHGEAYNPELFVIRFLKNKELLVEKKIVPCKPCDKLRGGYVNLCSDCDHEFTDTLYYGR